MFVLRVSYIKGKGQSQDKVVQINYREEEKYPGAGDIFRTRPNRPWRPPSLLYDTMGTESFPGVKRLGCGVNHPPHLTLRLKKE